MEKLRVLVLEADKLRDLGLAKRSLLTADILDELDFGEAPTEGGRPECVGEDTVARFKLLPVLGIVLSRQALTFDPTDVKLPALSRDKHSYCPAYLLFRELARLVSCSFFPLLALLPLSEFEALALT